MCYKPIAKTAHIKNLKLFNKLFVFMYVFAFAKNIDFCPTNAHLGHFSHFSNRHYINKDWLIDQNHVFLVLIHHQMLRTQIYIYIYSTETQDIQYIYIYNNIFATTLIF